MQLSIISSMDLTFSYILTVFGIRTDCLATKVSPCIVNIKWIAIRFYSLIQYQMQPADRTFPFLLRANIRNYTFPIPMKYQTAIELSVNRPTISFNIQYTYNFT